MRSPMSCQAAASGVSGPQPALGISRRDIRKRNSLWLANQQWVRRRGLGDNQRQARELASGPCLGAKAKFLSFNPLAPDFFFNFSTSCI